MPRPHTHMVIGAVYGRLTVVELMTEKYRGKEKLYLCTCSCGNIKASTGTWLRKGLVVSCGCAKRERPGPNPRRLSAGEIFGRLTVLDTPLATSLQSSYDCLCSCGAKCSVVGTNMVHGGTKSCGCLMRETTGNNFRTHGLSGTKSYKSAAQSARAARKIKATPSWANIDKIGAIYAECERLRAGGRDVEVDHAIPLKGKLVCGLHVHYNLRIIPTEANRSKSNSFEV